MTDIIIETARAIVVGLILFALLTDRKIKNVRTLKGWNYIIGGFGLIFFGMLIDITDNFAIPGKDIIIGDTGYQAFLEKIVGSLFGFSLLALGIWTWIPRIIAQDNKRKADLEEASRHHKTLSGLLPICLDCKKIRDAGGYWHELEKFISANSDAELSHGFCEECLEKRYPKKSSRP